MAGGQTAILAEFAFNANSDTTVLKMTQIRATSPIMLTPLTESAMNEKCYICDQKKDQLIVHHSNSASADRKSPALVTA
jgi:hypothetical protein